MGRSTDRKNVGNIGKLKKFQEKPAEFLRKSGRSTKKG